MFCSGSSTSSSALDGIAPEVGGYLVHFIHHEDRIVGLGALDALDDLAGQRADVGAPMATDLRLVSNAAQRDTHELASHRLGDRPAQRGLADSGRSGKAEDRLTRRAVLLELADGQILQDAVLDLLQAVVVRVQHLFDRRDVEIVLAGDLPGHRHHPVEIGARHVVLRGRGIHAAQPVQLSLGLFARLFRHAGLRDLFAQFVHLLRPVVAFAQLLLDLAHMLAQVVLALRFAQLLSHFGLQAAAEFQDLDLAGEQLQQPLHPLPQVDRLQDLLALLERQSRHLRGNQVRQNVRILNVAGHALHLVRQVRRELHDAAEHLADFALERLDFQLVLFAMVGSSIGRILTRR